MNSSRVSTFLNCTRLMSLVTAVTIVVGSLCLYSSSSLPLNLTDEPELDNTWMIQSITDRRLISTLVAAQASIFCPLFILLSPPKSEEAAGILETVCHFLMPLGLAFSWMFSILFDVKTTDLTGQSNMCLLKDSGCILFGFLHGLKYAIILLFAIETSLVALHYIITQFHSHRHIQLPLDDIESKKINCS